MLELQTTYNLWILTLSMMSELQTMYNLWILTLSMRFELLTTYNLWILTLSMMSELLTTYNLWILTLSMMLELHKQYIVSWWGTFLPNNTVTEKTAFDLIPINFWEKNNSIHILIYKKYHILYRTITYMYTITYILFRTDKHYYIVKDIYIIL